MSGIFINYRRSDSPDATDRIYDRLVAEFGRATVFKDIDSIPLGRDFRSHLSDMVGNCAVVLAVVGPHWTEVRDETGERRLEDADDFVRIELEAALARNIPVVPVLVSRALMPASAQLPASLAPLAYRQSIEVRPDPDFHHDATRLLSALRQIIDPNAPRDESAPDLNAPAVAAKTEPKWRRRAIWAMSVAAVAMLALVAIAVPTLRQLRSTPPVETRLEIGSPVATAAADVPHFALSPDGRQIVFVATGSGGQHLWLRSLAATSVEPLAGTVGAQAPFWSPDGRSIGFFAGTALLRQDLESNAPRKLATVPDHRGGTWNADGVIVFAPSGASGLMRVSATGGAVQPVTTLGPKQVSHRWPWFLPDGRRFLFLARGEANESGIYLGSLDGTAPVRLNAADRAGVYLPSGWLLWVQSGTLVGQRLDAGRQALTGDLVTLARDVDVSISRSTISAAAGLVAFRADAGARRQWTWFDRQGTARALVGDSFQFLADVAVSPDGRRAIVSRGDQNSNADLWLHDGGRTSRITFDAQDDFYPVWSPDGSQIAFRSDRSGAGDVFVKTISGLATERRVTASAHIENPTSWSPDGRYLMYADIDPLTRGDLWVAPMTADSRSLVFLATAADECGGMFSPDGRWVAYHSDQSGRNEVYVRPFTLPGVAGSAAGGNGGQVQISTAGGVYPAWRRDGKELYFRDPDGAMMAVAVTASAMAFDAGTPIRLFPTRTSGGAIDSHYIGRQYDIGADGGFLFNTVSGGSVSPITLIQNWNPEANRQ